MVKQCYVLNCKTGRRSCNEKVSLFRAPKDEFMLELWRNTVPQKERLLRSTDRICEKHFEKSYIIPRYEPSTIGDFFKDHLRPKLAPNAVPTIFRDIEKNDPRIQKYKSSESAPTPKKHPIIHQIYSEPIEIADAEVSDIDHIPICFKCLIGNCDSHN